MAIDAVCGLGIAAHVPHLPGLVDFRVNVLMEVNMCINFDRVRELVT